MKTTIDGAGRIVVPKAIRDAMGLSAGAEVDLLLSDGRLEIEVAPTHVEVDTDDGLPRLTVHPPTEPLTVDIVRDTIEATRR